MGKVKIIKVEEDPNIIIISVEKNEPRNYALETFLKGDAGHTPEKGIDYFTESDKSELEDVIEADLQPLLYEKVDKVANKGLSTNDYDNTEKANNTSNTEARHTHANKNILDNTTASYTNSEKNKLSGIEENANNYVLPSDVVQDSNYVHTDNNYTAIEKQKLAGLSNYDDTEVRADITELETNKANVSDLSEVATSGDYNDLTNKPTNLSSFTDDLGSNPTHTHEQYLTEHQDLTDYVKNTDYATGSKGGVVKTGGAGGIITNSAGFLNTYIASNSEIDAKTDTHKPIVPSNLDYAVNSVTLTNYYNKAYIDETVGNIETLLSEV